MLTRTRPALTAALLLSLAAAPASAPTTARHTFHYAPAAGATPAAVDLAGDFNDWSTTAAPLAKAADGSFAVTVDLPVGRHQYKFVVDGTWTEDPSSDKALDADDGHQGHNSGVDVKPTAAHAFRFTTDAKAVFVAGDFNGWSTSATPMAKGADGAFAATVDLPVGVHHYKFVADGAWTNDPAADAALDAADGLGGKNSGVDVKP